MKELLSHMLKGILGEEIEVKEEAAEDGFVTFFIEVPKDKVGLVIGKGGKTINALKNILKIRAIKENVRVDIQVNEA
jgi:predicted RNA-binding protein YlqC (UPF0109 family)